MEEETKPSLTDFFETGTGFGEDLYCLFFESCLRQALCAEGASCLSKTTLLFWLVAIEVKGLSLKNTEEEYYE